MEHMEKLLTLGLVNAAASAVLAVGAAGLALVLARRPAWLHCLWLLVLLKLITPPLFEIPIPGRPSPAGAAESASKWVEQPALEEAPEYESVISDDSESAMIMDGAAMRESPASPEEGGSYWRSWRAVLVPRLALVWVLGTVGTLILAAVRVIRFHRLLRRARPAPIEVQDQVRELAGRLGLRRAPGVWWIEAPLVPMLWAVACRPRLVVPRKLWKELSQRQRSLLLAHELAHLRRGDHIVRLFELLVTALFWWLPVVWWARHALRDAEEQCCDAWVVWAFPDESRTYAETLLDTIDFLNPSRLTEPLLASGFGRAQHLRRRLTMIMVGTTPRRLGNGGALLAFGLSMLLLPLSPSWAQKADDAKPAEGEAVIIELTDDVAPKAAKDAKQEIHVVVASDGDVQEIKTDSLQKAKELIRQRIEAMAKEKGDSSARAESIKALKQALSDLEKAKSQTIELKLDNVHANSRPHEADPKLAAETKAKIESARARVDALRKELDEKRQQLQKAQSELAKLSAEARVRAVRVTRALRLDAPARVEERRIVVKPVKPQEAKKAEEHANADKAQKAQSRAFAFTVPDIRLNTSDRQRLESLERKLEKLLDEVSSLKKHDEKGQ